MTERFICGSHPIPFWCGVAKTFAGRDVSLEAAQELWRTLAFHNFVQESVGPEPGYRPTATMWRQAQPAFIEALEFLQPRLAVVFGKGVWDNLPRQDRWLEVPGAKHWLRVYALGNSRAVHVMGVNHPASRGFSWRKWCADVAAVRGALSL